MNSLVQRDAVLSSGGVDGFRKLAAVVGVEHFVAGSKPGSRVHFAGAHVSEKYGWRR